MSAELARHGLRSLLDMLELKLQPLCEVLLSLSTIAYPLSTSPKIEDYEIRASLPSISTLRSQLAALQVGGQSLSIALERLEESLVPGGDRKKVEYYAQHVLRLLYDELSGTYALTMSSQERRMFDLVETLFGGKVATKFPSLKYDSEQASKCLALGLSTAAAFHMLRCLEAAMRAIARSLEIPDPVKGSDRNWSNALRDIGKEVDSRWPKPHRVKGDGVLFERFHSTLVAMQNPYRNATMHLEEKYTESEARKLLELVRGILQDVAARMDEDGEPKA